ncbi:MAG: hypothetical protein AAFU55_04740, partial [Pseudomonadota bacterium]
VFGLSGPFAAPGAVAQTAAEETQDRTAAALRNLRELLANRQALQRDLQALSAGAPDETEEQKAARDADADELRAEIAALSRQIGAIAAGVSDEEFRGQNGGAFDLEAELQALVEPFVVMMRDATENARQIERLRRAQSEARRRASLARRALETLEPVRDQATDDAVIAALEDLNETWEKRADAAADLANALDQQLADRLSDRGQSREAVNEAASGFFKDRGLSLLLGVLAFTGVFFAMRLIHRAASWLRVKRRIRRNFQTRLANLIFTVLTFLLAVGAMLVVFNLRNDWLLLGVFALMLLAFAWIGIKMLPAAVEQITLLLNLGAVQEDERVVIDGISYQVRKLDFYTDFVNPALDADFTLPVRTLIGMRSRPTAPDEPWFPTRRGDWVRLADEAYGQVVSQSPDMVELQIPGGSQVTYATADFLAEKPENLSDGFRAEIVFGLSYRHQDALPGAIMAQLKAHIADGIAELVPEGYLRDVGVEMLEAADSAVNFEVEADLVGEAAPMLEEVERELTRLCVDACNKFGWEIPFPQLVVHKA